MRLRAGTRSNEYIALILGYLIIAVLLVALFSSGFIRISTSPSQSPSQVSTIFIFNASKTIELTGGGAVGALNEFKQFSLSNTDVIEGAFTSTHGAEMYIVPYGGGSNYTKYYTYSTGNVTSGRIFVALAAGTYFFVIANPVSVSTNITITQSIEALPLPSDG